MIQDLENKSLNEKYHNSIRYFSHSLKGENRRAFIFELSKYNVHLAAMCVMSAEKDVEFENKLIETAKQNAEDFNDLEKSARGFLALVEFESFEIVSNLLIRITHPVKTHFKVLKEILKYGTYENFIIFLQVITEINSVPFLKVAADSYRGTLELTKENQKLLRNLIDTLKFNNEYGILEKFLKFHNLYDDIPNILNLKCKKEILKYFLFKNVSALKIFYEIAKKQYSLNQQEAELLINFVLQIESFSALLFSLHIANENNLKEIATINERLEKIIITLEEKNSDRLLRRLIANGLHPYIDGNTIFEEVLNRTFSNYRIERLLVEHRRFVRRDNNKGDNITIDEQDFNTISTLISNNTLKVIEIFEYYFSTENKTPIELLISLILENFTITIKEISLSIKNFEFDGYVDSIKQYGCNVTCDSFKSFNTLFLHIKQIVYREIQHPNEVLKEGQLLKFRIVGFSSETMRVNISSLGLPLTDKNCY